MLKKIGCIALGCISIVLIVALILNSCQSKIKDKGLSLIKCNNYTINDEERQIKQILYFTKENSFNTLEAIDSIALTNEEETKKIVVKAKNIKKTNYVHKYDGTKYYSYEYFLIIPVIKNDFKIERTYIKIIAKNKELKYEIGSLYLLYCPEAGSSEHLDFKSMLGHATYTPFQTLEYIDIKLENKGYKNVIINSLIIDDNTSLSANVGNSIFREKEAFNDTIIGYMEKNYRWYFSYEKRQIIDTTFIIINYEIDDEEYRYVIDTYCFYDNGYFVPNDDTVVRTYLNKGHL